MSTARLGKIERQLSPQHAALHWYAPTLDAMSREAFILLHREVRHGRGIDALLRDVMNSARASARGTAAQRDAAAKAAGMEAYFVVRLLDQANRRAVQEWEAWMLRGELAAVLSVTVAEVSMAEPRHRHLDTTLRAGRVILHESRARLASWDRAADGLSRTYLAGHRLLFAGARARLAVCLEQVEMLAETIEVMTDQAEPETDITDTAAGLMEDIVAVARCDVWEWVGDDRAADEELAPTWEALAERDRATRERAEK